MPRVLPVQPNLEHLRKQAKDLLRQWRQEDPSTHRQLAEAQLDVAREYGFATWGKLKAHVESVAIDADPVRALTQAIIAHDPEAMRRLLASSARLRSAINDPLPDNGPFGETALIAAVQRGHRARWSMSCWISAPTSIRRATGGPAGSASSTRRAWNSLLT